MKNDLTPIEDLDQNILKLCSRINAATCELLVLIREFDERAGWLQWGLQNCAEWLAWRCDLSMTTALDKARDDEALEVPALAESSWSMRQADAFVSMVNGYLCGDGDNEASNDNYLVTIHVEQSALAGNAGRSALPIESVRRLCCDSRAVVITEDDSGEPLSIGRKSRIIPKAIARAVRARDNNCCTFPGCGNRRFLHCHHVEHWSNGGETSLENLMLLCTKHHTLVHEGGFRIDKDFQNRWIFIRPDGIAVPHSGYHPTDILDISGAYKIPPAGGLLRVAEKQQACLPVLDASERTHPPAASH